MITTRLFSGRLIDFHLVFSCKQVLISPFFKKLSAALQKKGILFDLIVLTPCTVQNANPVFVLLQEFRRVTGWPSTCP